MEIFGHPDFDGHEQGVFSSDTAAGLRAIIALHNNHWAPAMGAAGCSRMPMRRPRFAMSYASPAV